LISGLISFLTLATAANNDAASVDPSTHAAADDDAAASAAGVALDDAISAFSAFTDISWRAFFEGLTSSCSMLATSLSI
jgi:hypothetical protein